MLPGELGSIGPLAFQVASLFESIVGAFIMALVSSGRDSRAVLKCCSPFPVKCSFLLFS